MVNMGRMKMGWTEVGIERRWGVDLRHNVVTIRLLCC